MEKARDHLFLILSFSFSFLFSGMAHGSYVVTRFGAQADGISDDSQAFLDAWASACGSFVPATVYVPPGNYLLFPTAFQGPCKNSAIRFKIDGRLVASGRYTVYADAGFWVKFEGVNGVTIDGGLLEARGAVLWACKASSGNCPSGATSLLFHNAKRVTVNNLISMNSQLGHIAFNGCEDITVNGVTVRASGDSPNTDGIHVQQSVNIVIINTSIRTGDDCISIGPGTQNLWIEHMACGPGHGISIGSLGKDLEEPGVENVTVKDVVLSGTQNGVRIKTWARESNGYVRGVLFEEALMINVNNPIIIDQDYCPHNLNCPNQGSGVKISGVKYRNIRGTSASKVAVTFNCSPNAPCQDIRMENVELTYLNQLAQASCSHAEGSSSGVVYPQSCL